MEKVELFSKKHSICLKGFSILIILIHHIFWNQFFGTETKQLYILPIPIISRIVQYGFCFNHVFFAITGYGIAEKLKEGNENFIISREKKLLILFVPTFIFSVICYSVLTGNIFNIYNNENFVKRIVYLGIDAVGLADLFKTPSLNPTWWYLSALQFCMLFTIILARASKKIRFEVPLLFILLVIHYRFDLYFCCCLSCYIGYYINKSGLLLLLDNKLNTWYKKIIYVILICVFWYVGNKILDIHFISSLFLPLLFISSARYLFKIKVWNSLFLFIGKYSGYIFLTHTLFYMILLPVNQFVYSFKYAFITYLIVLFLSVLSGILIQMMTNIGIKVIRKGENCFSNRKFQH